MDRMQDRDAIPQLRERILACWLGKAVGGTLGIPVQGQDGPFALNFYDPVPTRMLPNDDLDLQVLWACTLDGMGRDVRVDSNALADAWLAHVAFPWDEYGVAIRNLKAGLRPPECGSVDNWFRNGMGGAIRSEIWACLAAGNPNLAAQYAHADACVDHAGEGIWAEVFLAALQAAAFVESEPQRLLQSALWHLPTDSRVARAVADTVAWWRQDGDWQAVRSRILQEYGEQNFTDVTMNVAFTILGWLASDGSFSRAICTAVNCGKDTDCTGATVGALMGILDPHSITDRWVRPIGRELVVDKRITGIIPPPTLSAFADLILSLRERLRDRPPVSRPPSGCDTSASLPSQIMAQPVDSTDCIRVPTFSADATRVDVDGYWMRLEAARWSGKAALALSITFTTDREWANANVMFNSGQAFRLWIDGRSVLAADGAPLSPSFHRVHPAHIAPIHLSAGAHQLVVLLHAPQHGCHAESVWGVCEQPSMQWIQLGFGGPRG